MRPRYTKCPNFCANDGRENLKHMFVRIFTQLFNGNVKFDLEHDVQSYLKV